jgi:hypothetical protein
MIPLASLADYELLIGPVGTEDEPRLDYLLIVSSSVVAGVAPGLLPWVQDDPVPDPGPVPEPAVLVTCQTASTMMTNPAGNSGAVTMEKVGLIENQYAVHGNAEGLLPSAWRTLLRPWRPPDLASVRLAVPHPLTYGLGGYGGSWWWPMDRELAEP